jgi:hypothetical protein|tara:strand:- start:907 stop:1098 length:192 start_codon:yes stop_codon:yes gene_type:complete
MDQFSKDIRELFSSKTGERILANMKVAYGDRISFSKDPCETAFKEGQRSIYLEIKNVVEKDNE